MESNLGEITVRQVLQRNDLGAPIAQLVALLPQDLHLPHTKIQLLFVSGGNAFGMMKLILLLKSRALRHWLWMRVGHAGALQSESRACECLPDPWHHETDQIGPQKFGLHCRVPVNRPSV